MPKSGVIIGLGTEIVGDDGVGILVAQRLAALFMDHSSVDVIPLPWAGLALLEALVGRERAAIIDCLTSGTRPAGSIVRLDEHEFRGSVRLNSFHDINYPTALRLGRELGWPLPETIAIWGIEGLIVNRFSDHLSPPVAKAAETVIKEVSVYFGWSGFPQESGSRRDHSASRKYPTNYGGNHDRFLDIHPKQR